MFDIFADIPFKSILGSKCPVLPLDIWRARAFKMVTVWTVC